MVLPIQLAHGWLELGPGLCRDGQSFSDESLDLSSGSIPVCELLTSLQLLTSSSLTVCDDDSLQNLVFLSSVQDYLAQLQKQFHDQRVFSNVNLTVDRYSQGKFTPMFQDKGKPWRS